ncbi:winged helix-turn-helix domain-containing protein [Geobacillus thermoleovorans]|uniref:winged helix-turn-helix domain-containing protein n=1 Tax=Geobacillus thermoleovorans TaxID=33941 RepID=UPI003EBE51DF
MHRKGLSWTQPTYTLAKGDPDRQKHFEKQMDLFISSYFFCFSYQNFVAFIYKLK